MLKTFSIITLSIFIVVCLSFLFFYLSFHRQIAVLKTVNDSNRQTFARNLLLRQLFRLNERGDARSDYYNQTPYPKLKVIVYSSTAGTLYNSSLPTLTDYLKSVIQKPGGITIEKRVLEDQNSEVDDKLISKLSNNIPSPQNDTAIINLWVLSSFRGDNSILGQTTGAFGFAIYKNSIERDSDDTITRQDLEKQVILHEIGHLLGVEHIERNDCIMRAAVDSTDVFTLTFVPTTYCTLDIGAIQTANF